MTDTAARPRGLELRPRRGVRAWLVLLLLVLLAAVLTWVVAFSSVLGVASVRVRGNTTLSAAAIEQSAAIKAGTPLIRLDTSAIRARLLAVPQIKSVQVSTSYPNAVTIAVSQRVAVGFRDVGGVKSLIDGDDVAFEQVSAQPKGLPLLVAGANSTAAGTDAAEAAVAAALPTSIAAEVGSVTASSPESVTLALTDGRTVLWGGTDRGADKAKLLSALLGQPGRYYDISDPDTVISR